jgi:hypothetical protein
MRFIVNPQVPVGMTTFAFAAAACGTLTCGDMTCSGVSGTCDLVCTLKIIKPAQTVAE